MAVSWGFAMLLVLTLVALITFSQPLFQSEAVVGHTQSDLQQAPSDLQQAPLDLQQAPEGVVARGAPVQQNLLNSKTLQRAESSRQSRTRKLIQSLSPPGDKPELNQANAKPHIARRSVLATFQSDRMVPTGPNPLHNSNRSQVIFP
ncbi:hypothetical protein M758_9G045300 [Ceratodon purpureus]|uniref:Uncharacterized protein n=1 Tax=Ceratodon purpureus TaxID=3225 RepID=A0A8T0GWB0_CERPU|nr:hypothetical protein KC19_9G045800 [Ceratodon purpureus]KAG0605276.1 hypothetical protein M758_9G045300 [Ceratodon purpureus]